MYCGFADAELLRGGADSGPVLYDVLGQALCPLLHVTLQNTTLPASSWSILCGADWGYVRSSPRKTVDVENFQKILMVFPNRPAAACRTHRLPFPAYFEDKIFQK